MRVARLGFAWTHRVGTVIRHCSRTNRNDMYQEWCFKRNCQRIYVQPACMEDNRPSCIPRTQPCMPSNVGIRGVNSSLEVANSVGLIA